MFVLSKNGPLMSSYLGHLLWSSLMLPDFFLPFISRACVGTA